MPSGYAPPPPWMPHCPCCLYSPCDSVPWVAAAHPHRYVGYCTSDAYIGTADAGPCESAWMRRGDECSCSLRTYCSILGTLLRCGCFVRVGAQPRPSHLLHRRPLLTVITHAWLLPPACTLAVTFSLPCSAAHVCVGIGAQPRPSLTVRTTQLCPMSLARPHHPCMDPPALPPTLLRPRAPCLRVLQPPLGSASMAEPSWTRCLPPCETSLAWAASPTPPSCTGSTSSLFSS